MALSIVFKQVMQQLPLKYASGPDADDTLRAMLSLSETSRAMRAELASAVDLRVLRNDTDRLRTLYDESVWDAYVAGLRPLWNDPDEYANPTYCLEAVDEYTLEFFQRRFPDAVPHASWITRTFKSPYGVMVALDDYGHDPVECLENKTMVVKPFADVTFDDVLFDFFEQDHTYEGSTAHRP